ncbi:MAG: hypothetical protein ABI792_09365 [bacterium]
MLKSKAIDTLKTFSKEEYKRFQDFVASPYFNRSKRFVTLTTVLKKFLPQFNSEMLTEEYVYGKLYGKNKFSYSLMKNLMSEYLKLCESFLIHDRISQSLFTNTDNIISLMNEYQTRGLDKLFNIRLKSAEEQLASHKLDSYFFEKKLEIVNFKLDYKFNKSSFKTSMATDFFEKALLELCRITNSLYKNTNSIYYVSKEFNLSMKNNLFFIFIQNIDINNILKIIKFSDEKDIYIIKIYLELIQLVLDQNNEKSFFNVKKLIFENINNFSNHERYSLLNLLRNYCIEKRHDNKLKFIDEGHEINLKMIEAIDFEKDKLDSLFGILYMGIVIYEAKRKNFTFAETFIDENASLLRKENKKDICGFTRSHLEFEKGNFENALNFLSNTDSFNMVYYIGIKNLYLKIYYELGYYEEAFSILDTFKHYLDNNKMLKESVRSNLKNSIKLYSKLFRIRVQPEKYTDFDVKMLEKYTESKNFESEKSWMIKKLNQLYKIVK